MKKIPFNVRMYDAHGNRAEEKYPAASHNQALLVAMTTPRNEKYQHFGLIGDDGNCHTWEHRAGAPRGNPERFAAMRDLAPSRTHARTGSPPPTARAVATRREEPLVMGKALIERLTHVVMTRALPQMSATETFMARVIGEKMPLEFQSCWTKETWPHVMGRLLKAGVLLKADHMNYRRAPEYVGRKLFVEEEEPAEHPKTNGAAPPPTETPAEPPAITTSRSAEPAASPIAAAETTPVMVPLDERMDAVLLMAQMLLTDTRARTAALEKLQDRITRVIDERIMSALDEIESIRKEALALVRAEEHLPERAAQIVQHMRRVNAGTVQSTAA